MPLLSVEAQLQLEVRFKATQPFIRVSLAGGATSRRCACESKPELTVPWPAQAPPCVSFDAPVSVGETHLRRVPLRNCGEAGVNFSWTLCGASADCFALSPSAGPLLPGDSVNCALTFSPDHAMSVSCEVRCPCCASHLLFISPSFHSQQ